MVFIPREAQEKIQNLEKQVERLSQENQDITRAHLDQAPKKNGNWGFIFVFLFVLCGAYITYLTFYSPSTELAVADTGRDSLTIYRDGQIEKISKSEEGNLIYRVQLGAFASFTLEQYNINLDAMEEVTIDGMNRISLGGFSRLVDAQDFQQHMVQLGMDQSYIVVYNNEEEMGSIYEADTEYETETGDTNTTEE